MIKMIFTYGSYSLRHPFQGGWTEVVAESQQEALRIFTDRHPLVDGLVPCARIYTEDEFKETVMYKSGKNFGKGCVERLTQERKE